MCNARRVVDGVAYLALGAWFGALVMLVVAAGITFATVRGYRPALGAEPFNHPELADRAAAILAGGIVGNVLRGLAVVQGVCAAAAVVCVTLQHTVFGVPMRRAGWLRAALIALPVAVWVADRVWLSPGVWAERAVMYDPGRPEPDRAAAKQRFDRLHKLSERAVGLAGLAVAGAVLASPWVVGRGRGEEESGS